MRDMKFLSGILLLGALLTGCRDARDRTAELGRELRPFTEPPEIYREEYGTYRSPLLFYNGDSVRTAADWVRRRAEIRTRWDSLLGAWPPVIAGQRFEYADTLPGEDFDRYRVR